MAIKTCHGSQVNRKRMRTKFRQCLVKISSTRLTHGRSSPTKIALAIPNSPFTDFAKENEVKLCNAKLEKQRCKTGSKIQQCTGDSSKVL